MALVKTFTSQFMNTLHFIKPIRIIVLSFGITGYLIYKIPISEEAKQKSKFLHPELGHEH